MFTCISEETKMLRMISLVKMSTFFLLDLHEMNKMCSTYIEMTKLSFVVAVHFRFVVFRPFMDEILTGRIKSCSQEGVHGEFSFCVLIYF